MCVVCPRCGANPPADARFCPACGADLSGAHPHEERKLVSILFCDQVGSTARADGADPEDIRDRNRLYYDETRAHIERHGGTLEKYIGDAVMAVFGAPLARSDDAERAVRAGLAILDGIRELNQKDSGMDLHVRIGVCTGEAVVGVDAGPKDALATGDVVNTAARLQSAAPVDRVVVGEETYGLTKNVIRYEPIDPIDAKGKREPVRTWLALEPAQATTAPPALRSPLVGREHEMSLIRLMWERATRARQPHLVTIVGAAGIGKSRLAAEVGAMVESGGGRVMWGRCLPFEQQTPYHAAAQMIRTAAGVFENAPAEIAREKLSALSGSLFDASEAVSSTRHLSLLLGLSSEHSWGVSDSFDLQFAARRLFEGLSESAPLLVVFDDVHWADEPLLELVGYLCSHLTDYRVMLVALARPEFLESRPTWGSGLTAHTAITLSPLLPEDASEVARALLDAGDSSATIAKIVSAAEGNPLFIEELVASIGEDFKPEELPATVRAVIAARIDALPAVARSALLAASVMGKTFWRGVLARIGALPAVDVALDALETRGLIQRRSSSRVAGDIEFSFKHDLILDAAYATLPRSARRTMHTATADALEGLVEDRKEIASMLAYHRRESGDSSGARDYLLMAAERARDALAIEETYDLYEQAITLAGDDTDRVRIRYLRGIALAQLEDHARAVRELDEVIPYLDGDTKVEALIARSSSAVWSEQTDEAIASGQAALGLSRQNGPAELEPPALGLLSAGLGMRGLPGDLSRAIELGEEAFQKWVPGTRKAQLAEVYHIVANHYYWVGAYDRALDASNLAGTTAGLDIHSREFRLRGAGQRAIILSSMGRYSEAIAAADAAIELALGMGRPVNVVTNYSTLALREIFALDEALQRSAEVADRLGPSDFNMPWINARADLFTTQVLRGDVSSAIAGWKSLWEDAESSIAWERWLVTGRIAPWRAELELAAGHHDDAMVWARRAVELAADGGRKKYEAIARTTLGRVLIADGLHDDAAEELRRALTLGDELASPLIRWRARAALADAVDAEADTQRQDAAAIIREVAAGLDPARGAAYLAAQEVVQVLDAVR